MLEPASNVLSEVPHVPDAAKVAHRHRHTDTHTHTDRHTHSLTHLHLHLLLPLLLLQVHFAELSKELEVLKRGVKLMQSELKWHANNKV